MNESYLIRLTGAELHVLRVALGVRPHDEVRVLIDNIADQVAAADRARAEPPTGFQEASHG